MIDLIDLMFEEFDIYGEPLEDTHYVLNFRNKAADHSSTNTLSQEQLGLLLKNVRALYLQLKSM